MLERQRVAAIEKTPRPAPARAPEPERAIVNPSVPLAPVSADVVTARDAAVRACLKQGRASFEELLAAMPADPIATTDHARREALSRALSRMWLKDRDIKTDGTLWELV